MIPESPVRRSLFGLLVWRELLRALRRGQLAQLGILFLYFILLATVLFAVWWSLRGNPLSSLLDTSGQSSSNATTAFYGSLSLIVVEAELLFVAFVAPAYAATAIASEKDRHTLSLLQTTQLSDDEIVWGKAIASALVVLVVTLIALPLWLAAGWFSTMSLPAIASGYSLSVGTTCLASALGARAGCICPDSRSAVLRAYLYVAVFVVGLPILVPFSPFAIVGYCAGMAGPGGLRLTSDAGRLGLIFGYTVMQVAAGVLVLLRSPRHLRASEPSTGEPEPTAYPEPPRGRAEPLVLGPETGRAAPLPPLDAANPILWRERHMAHRQPFPMLDRPVEWLGAITAALAAFLFAMGAWQLLSRAFLGLDPDAAHQFAQAAGPRLAGSGWLVAAGVLFAGLFLVPGAVGVSGCIAAERQRGTLDSLLATLLPRRTMLWAKVRAHLERRLVFAVASLTAIGCGFSATAGLVDGLAVTTAQAAGFWFLTASAAWFSVRADTPGQALRWCLAPATGVAVMPLVFWSFASRGDTSDATAGAMWTAGVLVVLGTLVWWRAVVGLGVPRG